MRKLFALFSLVVLASLVLAACGAPAPTTTQESTSPTPVATEPEATEATEPPATEAPATGAETPTAAAAPVAGGKARPDRGRGKGWDLRTLREHVSFSA